MDDTTYTPVIAIFGFLALMALAIVAHLYDSIPLTNAVSTVVTEG